jgi:hypothetical protein
MSEEFWKWVGVWLGMLIITIGCVFLVNQYQNRPPRSELTTIKLPVGTILCGIVQKHIILLCSEKEVVPTTWWVYDTVMDVVTDVYVTQPFIMEK